MKKILMAAALTFGVSGLFAIAPLEQETVRAKTYDMSTNLANHLKKGTLPGLNSKIGTSRSLVKTRNDGSWSGIDYDSLWIPKEKYTETAYLFNKGGKKVVGLWRYYDYVISESSLRKHFGDPYKGIKSNKCVNNTHIYKAGKYYVFFQKKDIIRDTSWLVIGDKQVALYFATMDTIYR